MADAGTPTPDEVRRAAREIISRPEFRPPHRTPQQVVSDWIGRQFDNLFNHVRGGNADVLGFVIAGLAVAVIVVLLVRFARGLQRDPGTGVPVEPDVGRPATDWKAEAAAHEAAGEWREALRCRYRAMVADLAARGVVDEVPGRTAGEYRVAMTQSAPAAAPDFFGATELFERAWYGRKPTGPDDSARFRELSERVLVGAGQ